MGDRLVFLSDGAPWMRNWVNDMYPDATQILDDYHAVQHSGEMAGHIAKEDPQACTKRYADKLLREGVEQPLHALKRLPIRTDKGKPCKACLLKYVEANACRMDDPAYDRKGYSIGSGVIASAHRTVIQKRLKRSDQRWTVNGAQDVLNLWVLNMRGKWDRVTEELRRAA